MSQWEMYASLFTFLYYICLLTSVSWNSRVFENNVVDDISCVFPIAIRFSDVQRRFKICETSANDGARDADEVSSNIDDINRGWGQSQGTWRTCRLHDRVRVIPRRIRGLHTYRFSRGGTDRTTKYLSMRQRGIARRVDTIGSRINRVNSARACRIECASRGRETTAKTDGFRLPEMFHA